MPASPPNPRLQQSVETFIRIVSPPLDLLLAVGDRVARILSPSDPDYVPARIAHDGESAPRGLR
jgi:hypothetical protein